MTFRSDGDAQKNRIDALEEELETAREEAERLRVERDAALAGPLEAEPKSFERGSPVWIEWNGKWYRGTVKNALGASLWEIHYDGWSNKWDEAVGPVRIASGHRPPPGPIASPNTAIAYVGMALMLTLCAGILLWWWVSVS